MIYDTNCARLGAKLRDASITVAASVVDGETWDAFDLADQVVDVAIEYFMVTDSGGYTYRFTDDWAESVRALFEVMRQRGERVTPVCHHQRIREIGDVGESCEIEWCRECGAIRTHPAGAWVYPRHHLAPGFSSSAAGHQ